MEVVESTLVWRNAFDNREEDNAIEKAFRERLAHGFRTFRENAKVLAAEIGASLPDFTVHDITHIDSLWKVCDLLVPAPDYLNPTETFLLGSAFLTHDLGLGLSAYQKGVPDVQTYPEWRSLLSKELWRRNGIYPTAKDVVSADADSVRATTAQLLRLKHAERASYLAKEGFESGNGDRLFLLEDQVLRGQYGELIGEIAYSHWWSIDQVEEKFSQSLGAHPKGPSTWTVDRLKLAILLRVCDACHLDANRAPELLRALKKPTGVGNSHWRFSANIQFPHIEHSELCFTSTSPFDAKDRDAWWVGVDLLSMAHDELGAADALLERTGKSRLKARRVAGISRPQSLAKLIRTTGWMPVDTRVKATNVASLVARFGGKGLYGERPWIPIREMLQNAHDATLAKRVESNLSNDFGQIWVRLETTNGEKHLLEIEDVGIGMSEAVMTGPLLDFGVSYWDSALALQEHPKLSLDRFRPTGKFGIGFFSVFMLADHVQVISRTAKDAQADTRVLEFEAGVDTPPILRKATEAESLENSGTLIRMWLKNSPKDRDWFLKPGDASPYGPPFDKDVRKKPWTLNELCEWLCPASEVTILTELDGATSTAVAANDWIGLEPAKLVERSVLERIEGRKALRTGELAKLVEMVRPIIDETGATVARASICPLALGASHAISITGPMRSFPIFCLLGFVRGRIEQLDRNRGSVVRICGEKELARWATEPGRLAYDANFGVLAEAHFASHVRAVGGDTWKLNIARCDEDTLLSVHDIKLMEHTSEVRIVNDFWGTEGGFPNTIKPLPAGTIGLALGGGFHLFDLRPDNDPWCRSLHPKWKCFWGGIWGAVVEAITASWGVPLDDVLAASKFDVGKKQDGHSFTPGYDLIIRPSA